MARWRPIAAGFAVAVVVVPALLWLLFPLAGVLEGTRMALGLADSGRRGLPHNWNIATGLASVSRSGRFGMMLTVSYSLKARCTDYPELLQSYTTTYTYPWKPVMDDDVFIWTDRFPRSFDDLPLVRRRALVRHIQALGNPFVWDVVPLAGRAVSVWGEDGLVARALALAKRKGYTGADLMWVDLYRPRSGQLLGWDSRTRRWVVLAHQVPEYESPLIEN